MCLHIDGSDLLAVLGALSGATALGTTAIAGRGLLLRRFGGIDRALQAAHVSASVSTIYLSLLGVVGIFALGAMPYSVGALPLFAGLAIPGALALLQARHLAATLKGHAETF
jgi:hypothetical protein